MLLYLRIACCCRELFNSKLHHSLIRHQLTGVCIDWSCGYYEKTHWCTLPSSGQSNRSLHRWLCWFVVPPSWASWLSLFSPRRNRWALTWVSSHAFQPAVHKVSLIGYGVDWFGIGGVARVYTLWRSRISELCLLTMGKPSFMVGNNFLLWLLWSHPRSC